MFGFVSMPRSLRSASTRPGVGPRLRGLALGSLAILGTAVFAAPAEAQYTNQQFGLELGYQFIEDDSGLTQHAPTFGLRAGYKASDHWWFTSRAMLAFRDDVLPADRTVVLFHLTPVDVRYYFLTDSFRPFLGGGTTFHFLANTELPSTVQWGVGPVGGLEFKLRRNLFLGIQADAMYFMAFDGENYEAVNATGQLIFFL